MEERKKKFLFKEYFTKEGFNDHQFSETLAADPSLPMPSRFKRTSLPREYKVATEAAEPVESSVLLSVRAKPTGMNLTGETQVLRLVAGVILVGRYATGQNKTVKRMRRSPDQHKFKH